MQVDSTTSGWSAKKNIYAVYASVTQLLRGTYSELLTSVGGESASILLQHAVEGFPRRRHTHSRPTQCTWCRVCEKHLNKSSDTGKADYDNNLGNMGLKVKKKSFYFYNPHGCKSKNIFIINQDNTILVYDNFISITQTDMKQLSTCNIILNWRCDNPTREIKSIKKIESRNTDANC